MGDAAQLITALAALITSMGGAVAAVIIALRSGAKQAKGGMDAAQMSAMFDLIKKVPGADPSALSPPDQQDDQAPPPGPAPPVHP